MGTGQAPQAIADRPWLTDVATSDAALRQVLHGLPGVDQVGAEARAASLATSAPSSGTPSCGRSTLSIRMIDLTTLEGADTPGKVAALCAKALRPDPADPAVPPVAAVCVYPDLVATRATALAGSKVAHRLGGHRLPVRPRLARGQARRRRATRCERGADEVDMVIDRGRVPAGPLRPGLRGDAGGARGLRRRRT